MEKLLSSQLNIDSVPGSYILPVGMQPGKRFIPPCKAIPVIDLGAENDQGRANTVQKIIKASQEFGFFQVINHGISETVINDMMTVGEEFFLMSAGDDKVNLYSEDPKQITRVHTSLDYGKEDVHYWRDCLRHHCHPIENFSPFWPSKPTTYREIAATYTVEVRRLGLRLVELICEGLGIKSDYLKDELCKNQFMSINHYPPCPDPSLTLGMPKHCDPNLITLLHQGNVAGLQVLKDGEWIAVEPVRNAFVINLGSQLQIISNGMLHSSEHRVVTNSSVARTTIVTFLHPSADNLIKPANELVDDKLNPPKFRAFKYQEFVSTYQALNIDPDKVMKHFKLQV